MKSETVTIETTVRGLTKKGIWIGNGGPDWSSHRNRFIAFSLIKDSDTDFEEMQLGDEVTIEIPRWLAEREELTE